MPAITLWMTLMVLGAAPRDGVVHLTARDLTAPSDAFTARMTELFLGCTSELDGFSIASPTATADGLLVGAAAHTGHGCQFVVLAWPRGDHWEMLRDGHFATQHTVALERFEVQRGVAIAHFSRTAEVTLAPAPHCSFFAPTPGPPAKLVIRFVELVRPLEREVEIVRFISGIALVRSGGSGDVIASWSRTVHVGATGVELRREAGALAWFRDVGRFEWGDLPALVARSSRHQKRLLRERLEASEAECERTGRLDEFVEGHLEPLIGNMEDQWRRLPR